MADFIITDEKKAQVREAMQKLGSSISRRLAPQYYLSSMKLNDAEYLTRSMDAFSKLLTDDLFEDENTREELKEKAAFLDKKDRRGKYCYLDRYLRELSNEEKEECKSQFALINETFGLGIDMDQIDKAKPVKKEKKEEKAGEKNVEDKAGEKKAEENAGEKKAGDGNQKAEKVEEKAGDQEAEEIAGEKKAEDGNQKAEKVEEKAGDQEAEENAGEEKAGEKEKIEAEEYSIQRESLSRNMVVQHPHAVIKRSQEMLKDKNLPPEDVKRQVLRILAMRSMAKPERGHGDDMLNKNDMYFEDKIQERMQELEKSSAFQTLIEKPGALEKMRSTAVKRGTGGALEDMFKDHLKNMEPGTMPNNEALEHFMPTALERIEIIQKQIDSGRYKKNNEAKARAAVEIILVRSAVGAEWGKKNSLKKKIPTVSEDMEGSSLKELTERLSGKPATEFLCSEKIQKLLTKGHGGNLAETVRKDSQRKPDGWETSLGKHLEPLNYNSRYGQLTSLEKEAHKMVQKYEKHMISNAQSSGVFEMEGKSFNLTADQHKKFMYEARGLIGRYAAVSDAVRKDKGHIFRDAPQREMNNYVKDLKFGREPQKGSQLDKLVGGLNKKQMFRLLEGISDGKNRSNYRDYVEKKRDVIERVDEWDKAQKESAPESRQSKMYETEFM